MFWMFLFAASFPWKAALQHVSGVTSLLALCAVLGTGLVGYASSLKAKSIAERIGGARDARQRCATEMRDRDARQEMRDRDARQEMRDEMRDRDARQTK